MVDVKLRYEIEVSCSESVAYKCSLNLILLIIHLHRLFQSTINDKIQVDITLFSNEYEKGGFEMSELVERRDKMHRADICFAIYVSI